MRILIATYIVLGLQMVGYAQPNKEEDFKKVLEAVVLGFSKQDSIAIEKYINKDIGVYQLDRIGVFDHYNHFKAVSFADSYPTVLFRNASRIQLLPLQYGTLPVYDCEKEWNKKGLYVDTTKTDHLPSKICQDWNANAGHDPIPDATIQFFRDLENNSRRIVLWDNNKRELVFYLSYLNGKWYLTVVDNVTSDCSV